MCLIYRKYLWPKSLYMYFKVENAKLFLEKHSLKFSDPTKFNDPFETAIDYQKSLYTTSFRKYCERLEKPTPKDVINCDDSLFSFLSGIGVCCFTESDTDILMWAYYGENHRGVCFEFDPKEDVYFFNGLQKVEYKPKFETIKECSGDLFFDDIIYSKAKCWKHEKEWRVAKEKMADKIWPINPRAIKSVIFGCNMTDYRNIGDTQLQNYLDIIELLKRPEYKDVTIKQVQKDPFEYKLHSEEVPFLTYIEQKGKVVIISLKNQDINIEDKDGHIIYRALMCKWEVLNIPLQKGYYSLYNSAGSLIKLKVLV